MKFFEQLSFCSSVGVRVQRHYEIFETMVAPREYLWALKNPSLVTPSSETYRYAPRRSGVQNIFGWCFDAYFCEMPVYLAALKTLYDESGGRWTDSYFTKEELNAIESQVFVNCMGLGSVPYFDLPPEEYKVVRGYYAKVQMAKVPSDKRSQYFSYNYTPSPSVYRYCQPDPSQPAVAADVYCYPRSDGWILGGSREEGSLVAKGNELEFFPTAATKLDCGDFYNLGGQEVPAPIVDLNRDLIRNLSGDISLDIGSPGDAKGPQFSMIGGSGLRFNALRVSRDDSQMLGPNRCLIHNYGHGGSGVTLSWGCAVEVAKLVFRLHGSQPTLNDEYSDSPDVWSLLLEAIRLPLKEAMADFAALP